MRCIRLMQCLKLLTREGLFILIRSKSVTDFWTICICICFEISEFFRPWHKMVTITQDNAFWWFTIAEELQRNENVCQKEHQLNQLHIPRKIQTLRRTKRHARFTLQCALHASSLAQSTVDSSLIQYVMSCNSGYSRSLSENSRIIKVKFSHTRHRALGPELIPVYRQSARRWREVNHAIYLAVVCHCFLPGLRLPS